MIKAENKRNNFLKGIRKLLGSEDSNYTEYFRLLLNKKIFLTGDFSPSYALLKIDSLSYVKSLIELSGFELKIIFIMRDPVFRLWSAVRMEILKNKGNLEIITAELKNDLLMRALEDPHHKRRSDYMETIKNIEKVFTNSSICYLFYETLFTQESMQIIEKFLNIKIKRLNFSKIINSTPKVEIDRSHYEEVKVRLTKQYNFIKNHFPNQNLDIWSYK